MNQYETLLRQVYKNGYRNSIGQVRLQGVFSHQIRFDLELDRAKV